MLKLSVVGTGYLGATHAAAMSSLGFTVVGVDVDQSKIDLLRQGKVPFSSPDLKSYLKLKLIQAALRSQLTFLNLLIVMSTLFASELRKRKTALPLI